MKKIKKIEWLDLTLALTCLAITSAGTIRLIKLDKQKTQLDQNEHTTQVEKNGYYDENIKYLNQEKEYKKIENEQGIWAGLDMLIVLSTIGNGAIFVAKKINEKQKNTTSKQD